MLLYVGAARERGGASFPYVQSLIFLIKKIGLAPWEDNMMSQIRYIINKKSSNWIWVRQWSYPLIIPLLCLWAKSNKRTRGQGQLECDVTWICFCFDFDCSHAQWVRLLSHRLLERVSVVRVWRKLGGERVEFVQNRTSKVKEVKKIWM